MGDCSFREHAKDGPGVHPICFTVPNEVAFSGSKPVGAWL